MEALIDHERFRRRIALLGAQGRHTPFVHGAVNGFFGQVATIIPGFPLACVVSCRTPFPNANNPILGVTVGVIGPSRLPKAIRLLQAWGHA
jgi:molybdopterin/thiamine biosynthesis adenylyltransferase